MKCTAYTIIFNEPDLNNNIYTKESVSTEMYDKMVEKGDIIDYVIDEKGVKITIEIDENTFFD